MEMPPQSLVLRWCPVCGRSDRYGPFTGGSHYSRGARCTGQPVQLRYELPAHTMRQLQQQQGGAA